MSETAIALRHALLQACGLVRLDPAFEAGADAGDRTARWHRAMGTEQRETRGDGGVKGT